MPNKIPISMVNSLSIYPLKTGTALEKGRPFEISPDPIEIR